VIRSLWSHYVISIFLRLITLITIHFSCDIYVTKFKGCVVISVRPLLFSSDIYILGGSYLCWPFHRFELNGELCTAGCEANTNFADESICVLADNVQNEVVTIQRSQEVLKLLSLVHVDIPRTGGKGSDLPSEVVLQEYLQFPLEYFLLVLSFGSYLL
jgi:hypothetical protein